MLKRFQDLGSFTGTKRSRGGLTRNFLGAAQKKKSPLKKKVGKQTREEEVVKSRLLEPKRSNGPSYLSLSQFKPLGLREKKLSF